MALKWSWAFGPETALELNDLAQWQFSSTSPTIYSSSQDIIHTYTGDASDRWALQMDHANGGVTTPLKVGAGKGWVSFYFYFNDPANDFEISRRIIEIVGPISLKTIAIQAQGGNNFSIIINNSFIDQTSLGLAKDTWHNISIKYDMTMGTPSLGTWGAELFVNGISAASGSTTHGFIQPETEIYAVFNALEDAGKFTMLSDIIFYDSLTDPIPYGNLVTRVEMDRDSSDTGSWTPASNTSTNAQSANLSGSISTTPVVSEADPLDGENIIISSSLTIGAQLGITPTSIYGVTGHLFASGSSSTNLFSAVAQGSTPTNFTSGTAQIDGENMYAWVTAQIPSLPSPNPWTAGSTIVLKAEVSGS